MPERMRQKVTADMLMETLEKRKSQKPVSINGISFSTEKQAARYLYLMEAMEIGLIRDLRIWERVTIMEPHTEPGGEKVKGIFCISDFSYLVADPDYRDGFLPDDLYVWEAVKEQAPEGTRVYEFLNGISEIMKLKMGAKNILYREVM